MGALGKIGVTNLGLNPACWCPTNGLKTMLKFLNGCKEKGKEEEEEEEENEEEEEVMTHGNYTKFRCQGP